MAIVITRGTTKTLYFTLDSNQNQEWVNLGNIKLRISQGNIVVDKFLVVDSGDPTLASVTFTQEETLRFREGKGEFQLVSVIGNQYSEIVLKSAVFEVIILKSLWNEVVHNA